MHTRQSIQRVPREHHLLFHCVNDTHLMADKGIDPILKSVDRRPSPARATSAINEINPKDISSFVSRADNRLGPELVISSTRWFQ